MNDLLQMSNNLLNQYSYIISFISFLIGIVGIITGLFNWWRLRKIVQLREITISSHLQAMRKFKRDITIKLADNSIKDQFLGVYRSLMTMIIVVVHPSEQRLREWLEIGRIDKDDYDELVRII